MDLANRAAAIPIMANRASPIRVNRCKQGRQPTRRNPALSRHQGRIIRRLVVLRASRSTTGITTLSPPPVGGWSRQWNAWFLLFLRGRWYRRPLVQAGEGRLPAHWLRLLLLWLLLLTVVSLLTLGH